MAKQGSAAISWIHGTGTERVILLDMPLREVRPGFTQTAYTAESLDKTSIATVSVGSGAHELVGTIRYEDDAQGLLDLIAFGATNGSLTYLPNLTDPDTNYSVKLISPRDLTALTLDLDSQRAVFGEMQVEVRFRKTDQTAFVEPYEGTNVLFLYRAGDTLARATFSRADTAHYVTKGYGTDSSAASGAARVHWVDTDSDGIRETPTLLLEGATTNLVVQSTNFSVTWATTGPPTLTSGQTDPAGGATAYLIADTDGAAQQYISIQPTFTTSGVSKAISLFVRQGTALAAGGSDIQLRDTTAGADRLLANITWANGVPTVIASTGTLLGVERYIGGWYRVLLQTVAVTVANTNELRIVPASVAAQTGNLFAWGVQAENALNPSSYNPTAGGTDTRATDSLTFPWSARVQTMTVYLRYIQQGLMPFASGTVGLFGIGTAVNGKRMEVRATAGATTLSCVGSGVSGTVTPGATHGQVVEVVGWLRYTGSTRTATTQLQAAVNGVVGTAGSVSASASMDDTFGNNLLYVAGLAGGGIGTSLPMTHVAVMRGVQTIQTMRTVVGV